jgi:uncharacterized coiled-coil DUF342 family protein
MTEEKSVTNSEFEESLCRIAKIKKERDALREEVAVLREQQFIALESLAKMRLERDDAIAEVTRLRSELRGRLPVGWVDNDSF